MTEALTFTDEEERLITKLADVLRMIKEELKPLFKGNLMVPGNIPPYIQEVITRIYDVHGGIEILMHLANISYQTIKKWHRDWRNDSNYFMTPNCLKKPGRQKRISYKKDEPSTFNLNAKKTARKPELSFETMDEIKRNMPLEAQNACNHLKQLMVVKRNTTGNAIDSSVRQEVCRIVDQVGSVKPVALLTGLNDRVITAWLRYHSQAVS